MEMKMSIQGCEPPLSPLPTVTVPAMAYIPFQQYNTTYAPEQGMDNGTLFPELNKPFLGKGGKLR